MMLFYRKYGDPKNKPIVVLHGVLGLSDNWDNFGLSNGTCCFLR